MHTPTSPTFKILSALCASTVLMLSTTVSALGQQIPAGYMLVPTGNMYGMQPYAPSYGYPYGYAPAQQPAPVGATTSPDATTSSLRAPKDYGFLGEKLTLTATLHDTSNHPLAGRTVTLLSTRASDSITAISPTTDANGEATFTILGKEEGVATITALDSASGVVLTERPRLVFLDRGGMGGDPAAAHAASTPGTITLASANFLGSDLLSSTGQSTTTYSQKLKVNFPATVTANTPYDIDVSITDLNDIIQPTYTGTVSFTSSDAAAILPTAKVMSDIDQGDHLFARAVTFTTPGQQTLTITADSATQPAILTIAVQGAAATGDAPLISAPLDGALTKGPATIVGTSTPNTNLAILVDDKVFTKSQTDTTGAYSIPLTGLADGQHTLAVSALQADGTMGTTSKSITVTIDSIAPVMQNIDIAPSAVLEVGQRARITVTSEPKLSDAHIEIRSDTDTATTAPKKLQLIESTTIPGQYLGDIDTKSVHDYMLDVVLADAAGNTTRMQDADALRVVAKNTAAATPAPVKPTPTLVTPKVTTPVTPAPRVTTPNPTPIAPTAPVAPVKPTPQLTIINVQAQPHDGRADIGWPAPINAKDIAYYIIHYGTQAGAPTAQYVTPDARTTWYLGNLQNDTTYYYTVEGYDAQNNKISYSNELSVTPTTVLGLVADTCQNGVTISWKPVTTVKITNYELDYGMQSGQFTDSQSVPSSQTSATVNNLINGKPYYFTVRGLDATGNITFAVNEEISATPGSGGACHNAATVVPLLPVKLNQMKDNAGNTVLYWNPIAGATSYRVYGGTQPGVFDLPTVTITTTSLQPKGLTPDAQYYFTVRAIGANGVEALHYSNVVQIKVGPEALLALSLVGGIGGAWLLKRRKKGKN